MTVLNRISKSQATTNTLTLITGSIIQTTNGLALAITIKNTGPDTLSWTLYGGNVSDLSDGVVIKASADILTGAVDSYSNSLAPFEFYGVYVKSKVNDVPSTALVNMLSKG